LVGADATKEQFLQQAKDQGFSNPSKYFESLRKGYNDQTLFEDVKANGLTSSQDFTAFKKEAAKAGFKNPAEYGKRLGHIRDLNDKFTLNYSEGFLNNNLPKGYNNYQEALKDPNFDPAKYMKYIANPSE